MNMRILVVDDSKKHRLAAEKQLTELGNTVVTMSSYTEAARLVFEGTEKFDMALIDLMMPAESMTLGSEGLAHLGESMPVGYALAIKMALMGVKYVGVATDMNHHNHPASAIMDWFHGGTFSIKESTVLMVHAHINEDGSKDWTVVLNELLGQ